MKKIQRLPAEQLRALKKMVKDGWGVVKRRMYPYEPAYYFTKDGEEKLTKPDLVKHLCMKGLILEVAADSNRDACKYVPTKTGEEVLDVGGFEYEDTQESLFNMSDFDESIKTRIED